MLRYIASYASTKKKKSLKIKYIFVKIWWLNANGRLAKHNKKTKIKAYNK